MGGIGILGSGISGLQLALRLQQLGIDATLYSAQDADQLASGRPRNTVIRFGPAQQRERDLGVHAWDFDTARAYSQHTNIYAGQGLHYRARFDPPPSTVDFRVYLPALMTAFQERGGTVRIGAFPVPTLVARHDLLVVANGDRSIRDLFPVDEEHSPFTGPQRLISGGFYHGITEPTPHSVELHAIPGIGEIIRIPQLTEHGVVQTLVVEAIPGGPMEPASRAEGADLPGLHLEMVQRYAPELRERISDTEFELVRPDDWLRAAITPVVRRGWNTLSDGCVLAIGDAWITNDPLIGQGANLGSATAFALAEEICSTDGPLDEEFCRAASERLLRHADKVVRLTNTFLGPMPDHISQLFEAAAGDQRLADTVQNLFQDPAALWQLLSTEDSVDEFLSEYR
ncbi:hypothetical protein D5S17_09980 [Pseudonocardiaceae bacterium YIM PH 21723]|nr:hypothetical protein D5S17_09980 [Pseudonocardiaceae bacterium YIM PH 21723]